MPGFSSRLESMLNRCRKPWSWQSVLTCTVNRQQREVLRRDRNKKTAEKGNKKGWRGKGSGGAGPSKGSISQIEESTVSAVAGTQGNKGKGAARKDKGKRPQRGPMKCFVCGVPHRFFECPKWKSLLALADKKPAQGN